MTSRCAQSDWQQGLFVDFDGKRRDVGFVHVTEVAADGDCFIIYNYWKLKIKPNVLKGLDRCNLF